MGGAARERKTSGFAAATAEVKMHPATLNYLTHKESVQVIYRPVLAAYSVDGKGVRLDRNRLPKFPPEDEILTQSTEEGKFWHEQLYRCKYGWTAPDGVWINPVYYFYLNFVTIPIKKGVMAGPEYSDSDHEVFDWIFVLMDTTGKQAEDGIITKGRRKHWSFNTHAGFFLYYFCMGTRGDLGIAYDVAKTREQGQRLFERAYNLLPSAFQHAALDRSKDGEITAADVREDFDYVSGKVSTTLIPKNTIVFRETDKTPDAFRGMNLGLALIDEAGKYKKLKKVINATIDCLREGTNKHGTLLIGGTSDAIDNKSKDYEKQWKIAAITRGWGRWFIPAWKIAPPHWDGFTGRSMRELAEPAYLKERQEKLKTGDTIGYYFAIQENPLLSSECFHSATLSNYPAHKLYDQALRIQAAASADIPIRGRFEFQKNISGEQIGAYFVADPEECAEPGDWLLHPVALDQKLNNAMKGLHVAGVDDVYKDPDEIVDSDSLCAITVYRRFVIKEGVRSNMFVASYLARPPRNLFVREIHKMQLYFRARVMIENNDVFLKGYMMQKGLQDDMIWVNQQMGIRNSAESISHQEFLAQTWIDDHGLDDVWFPDILQGFKVWRTQNTDTGSAAHLTLAGLEAVRELPIKDEATDTTKFIGNVMGGVTLTRPGQPMADYRQQSAIRKNQTRGQYSRRR